MKGLEGEKSGSTWGAELAAMAEDLEVDQERLDRDLGHFLDRHMEKAGGWDRVAEVFRGKLFYMLFVHAHLLTYIYMILC